MNPQQILGAILADVDNSDYCYGLRRLDRQAEVVEVGEKLFNSNQWLDDVDTGEELDGCCCVGICGLEEAPTVDQIEKALQLVKSYQHDGQLVLVRGSDQCKGFDDGEQILMDPATVAIIEE